MDTTTNTPQAVDTSICNKAVLVSLSVSTWTARKYSKEITAKVNADHGASGDAGRYNKSLLPGDAESYKALMRVAGYARTNHYSQSLAWSDEGWRLLPTANYQDYTDRLRGLTSEFETALEDFLLDYPALVNQSRGRLNGMFRDSDYPDVHDLRAKFSIGVEFSPVPTSGDFRLDLAGSTIEAIEKSVVDRVERATAGAVKDSWDRLKDCVLHIHSRLSDPKAIFRDSLIDNARELTDILGRLNVTGDVNLETARLEVAAKLGAYEPAMLRSDATARAEVARDAQAILSSMNGLYGTGAV